MTPQTTTCYLYIKLTYIINGYWTSDWIASVNPLILLTEHCFSTRLSVFYMFHPVMFLGVSHNIRDCLYLFEVKLSFQEVSVHFFFSLVYSTKLITKSLRPMLSEAKRTRKIASFHSHNGLSNNVISRKPLIFSIWSIEQKMFLFDHIIDIRDENGWPGPAMTLFDELFLNHFKRYKLKIKTSFSYRF